MCLPKIIIKNLKTTVEKSWIRSVSHRNGSEDPDTFQNFMDPKHYDEQSTNLCALKFVCWLKDLEAEQSANLLLRILRRTFHKSLHLKGYPTYWRILRHCLTFWNPSLSKLFFWCGLLCRFHIWICRVKFLCHSTVLTNLQERVSPFRLKFVFAYKRNKANLDPFHLCFTISL